jgi:SAM-dependent methyltransferase
MDRHDLWNDWVSVEVYREYVESYPLYLALNRRIAELAELRSARRILDLGSGTGETTLACLDFMPARAAILGVDAAATMVQVARARVSDPRAQFRCIDVTDLSVARHGRFDRAVCNAASWLFPNPAAILARLQRLLGPDGLLVFNIPADRLRGSTEAPHPFQIELALALRAHLDCSRSLSAQPLFDPGRMRAALEGRGFWIETVDVCRYRARQEELIELMQIPAMAARLHPSLDGNAGLRVVRSAASRSDPELEVEVAWINYVARRVAAE